jgi:phosphoenolpyruvate carboxylase
VSRQRASDAFHPRRDKRVEKAEFASMKDHSLPPELRSLVREVSELWGEVIREEAGPRLFRKIESVREFLKRFRQENPLKKEIQLLGVLRKKLRPLSARDLASVTHSFSVLLELINLCENSVRSRKIRDAQQSASPISENHEIYLVLTAHPTESRAPEMVTALQEIQKILSTAVFEERLELSMKLKPLLRRVWYLRMSRRENPEVLDEAEYIYSIVFKPEVLDVLLQKENEKVYLRTWVGGDKDGHPGVDESVMRQSLQASRYYVLHSLKNILGKIEAELAAFAHVSELELRKEAMKSLQSFERLRPNLKSLEILRDGDARRVQHLKKSLLKFRSSLSPTLKRALTSSQQVDSLLGVFPFLVVPLELRESSDVFRAGTKGNPAIFRMLKSLKKLALGSDPRGYARGLIISMSESLEDLKAADSFAQMALGRNHTLPVIPLFEKSKDLKNGPAIAEAWIRLKKLRKFEVMLGYSDSSKEGGVLPSRLAIREALTQLEDLRKKIPGLQLTYFHGSGGSVARGGGSLESQTAHWPKSAFDRYKVTLQGEMIQRTFSTPEILGQYLSKVRRIGKTKSVSPTLQTAPSFSRLAFEISDFYRKSLVDPEFLLMVEEATAYRFLEELHFGSRPSKRKKLEGIDSLRAIPWILAWTQTRNLLPTWWGFGMAYSRMSPAEKKDLRRLARGKDPLLESYLQQLGFTLAKIEAGIWSMYLEQSKLSPEQKKRFIHEFLDEFKRTAQAFRALSGKRDFLWSKPWLKESIRLRAPMIHPLNVAQLTAWKTQNQTLLREASVGIACGMLTTG